MAAALTWPLLVLAACGAAGQDTAGSTPSPASPTASQATATPGPASPTTAPLTEPARTASTRPQITSSRPTPRTPTNAATSSASTTLPTLRQGSSGAAVQRLQQTLAALRYDLGRIDGRFGDSTAHAVVAFQKVNGLARTGVVTATVWAQLAHPVRPALRYGTSGSGLEVNLGRQVMYRAARGALAAIYDVSTGRPALPTPTSGSTPFHIWKRALWGTTGLGDMEQYVQYFRRGTLLAVHAYSYVPPYPASHGCIRLSPASAARLWSVTYVGEPLYTY